MQVNHGMEQEAAVVDLTAQNTTGYPSGFIDQGHLFPFLFRPSAINHSPIFSESFTPCTDQE